jgi:hypothetical protein
MKTRTDLLNHLAETYDLQRYLEIGVQVPELNFDKIKCPIKVGVDPDPASKAWFNVTSDVFFSMVLADQYMGGGDYDLIFIDGLHTAEQVKKDFENALKVLSPDGFIVLHDCNPLKEEHTIVPRPTKTGHWNGDVYKFAARLSLPKITVDIDNGCLVFKNTCVPYEREVPTAWSLFDRFRHELLNIISWNEFYRCPEPSFHTRRL